MSGAIRAKAETVEEGAKPDEPAEEPGGAEQTKGRADAADNTGGQRQEKGCKREVGGP